MNILYVSPFSHGANISPALHMAHLIANRGNRVYFYTVKKSYIEFKNKDGKLKIATPPENVEMHYINNKFLFSEIAYPFINPLKEYHDLLKIIQEKKIDIIHFYFPEHFVCLPLLRKKLFGNIPVVLSINGVPGYDWFYNNKYVDFIGKIYSKIILSRIIRNVDMIVPYSTVTINTLVSLGCDRRKIKSIVAHGVDVQFFYPADNKEKLREKYGLPKDAFIIIYTGRFVEVKRLDILIRAIGKVFKSIENVFLLLVGDGSLKEKLVSLAKTSCEGHIKFMDFVDHATLSEMYGASDMFALISSGEGISSSLLEACSSGLPSLVSNAGANGEIVKNGFNGYMLDMITEEGLAENIIEIKKNAKNLSDNARRYAIENLDWSIIINNYSEIYSLLRN